jgi:hypothetical protein
VSLTHVVSEQRIEVTVAPGLEGPALLHRIGDLNRTRFLPVIERVLSEYEQAGALLRIDRLVVNLGLIGEHELGGLEERLARALRAGMNEAVVEAQQSRRGYENVIAGGHAPLLAPAATGLLAAFEHYLLHGAWPYGAAVDPETLPAQCLVQLLAEDPVGLVEMLRRRGAAGQVLRRLVKQIPEAELRALLHRLEPAHAHYVIAYLDEIRGRHEAEPLVPATPEALRETLWTIVLRDALTQTGLQANRKAFLRRLLQQLGNESGAPVGALVLQLRRGGRRPALSRHEAGSLIEVLAELVAESPEMLPRPLMMAELSDLLRGTPRAESRREEARQLFAAASRTHPGPLRWLLRRHALEDPHDLARRIEGLLPLDEALRLLSGSGGAALAKAAERASTVIERAELLRLAAGAEGAPEPDRWRFRAAEGRQPFAEESSAVAALARLLEEGLEDDGALIPALERAQRSDPLATRRLLRDHAVGDARRLRLRLAAGGAGHSIAALLLPPHLASLLTALAAAAACTSTEWDMLLSIAGRTSESALPESLAERATAALARARGASAAVLRAELAAAPAGAGELGAEVLRRAFAPRTGERLSRPYSALERVAALWGADTPFSAAERAASIGRLLPSLASVAPGVLRDRLLAAGLSQSEPLLALLPPYHLRRLARLLMPRAEADAAVRLARDVSAATVRSLIETGELPAKAPAGPAKAISAASWDAIGRLLRRLDEAAVDRLIAALHARLRVRPGPGSAAPRWKVALELLAEALKADPSAVKQIIEKGFGAATVRDREVLALLGDAIAGGDIAERPPQRLRIGAGLAAQGMESVEWAAMLRARPAAAIRLVAERDPKVLGEALPRLLAEPEAPALLFSALAPAEREQSLSLGRMLTSRAGRLAIGTAKVARALAVAFGSQEWRNGGDGFLAYWMRVLKSLATLSEQAALARLLGPQRPGAQAKAQHPSEERDEKAVIALVRERPRGAATQLRKLVRDPRKRTKIVRALHEPDLIRLLALIAPARAAGLVEAGERIAQASRADGAPIDRAHLHQALLATAAEEEGDVCLLLRLLLDGGPAAPRPVASRRGRIEALLIPKLSGARDAPLRAALELRKEARRRADAVRDTNGTKTEAADAGGIHLANAGLVLVSAFLPRLFPTLDFLAPDPAGKTVWKNSDVRGRAAHLLQWLADGRSGAPEPQLPLNKLLCGIHPSEPVLASIQITEVEKKALEMLMATVLASWPPLRGSSQEALRQTFLRRYGKLTYGGNSWVLEVESKVVDILLEQLPWGYSTILHPWMTDPINVRWG